MTDYRVATSSTPGIPAAAASSSVSLPIQGHEWNHPIRIVSSTTTLIVVLIVEVIVFSLLRLPLLYNFNNFAFWDWGSYLVAHHLLQAGERPLSDFGWQYGLLPLFVQEAWFGLAGATPATFLFLGLFFGLAFTALFGKLAAATSGPAGRLLVVSAFPFLISGEWDSPHVLEPILLCMGLITQVESRLDLSLAFATAACFAKPTMGYVYGLILIVLVLAKLHRQKNLRIVAVAHELRWTAFVVAVLTVLLGWRFGWRPLVTSLLPIRGARAYRLLGLGPKEIIWGLLYFPGVKLTYYLGTPVLFLTVASAYLVVAGLIAGYWISAKENLGALSDFAYVATCLVMFVAFLSLFYGTPSSWNYYAYLLVAGVIATDDWISFAKPLIWTLCVIALLGNLGAVRSAIGAWKSQQMSPVTAGLFASPAERREFGRVAALIQGRNPALIVGLGGGELLFNWFKPPAGAFIVPGVASSSQVQRKVDQLRASEMIVVPTIPQYGNPIELWPDPTFSEILDNRRLVFAGTYFRVYETKATLK